MSDELVLPEYDVVIATRNREAALRGSVPLIMNQTVPPRRLIVCDSTDDHASVCRTVERAHSASSNAANVELVLLQAPKPSVTLQRNMGLSRVGSPVVFVIDDDSFFYPDAAEQILRIYALDTDESIGGVCAAPASRPHAGSVKVSETSYKIHPFDRVRLAVQKVRSGIENTLFPDPLPVYGASRFGVRPLPDWFQDEHCAQVEFMIGFRMTFRTASIRRYGFDEVLFPYALCDDTDASFSVASEQLLVAARDAKICHYRFPTKRGDGRFMGVTQILNRGYTVCKHAEDGSKARRVLVRFCRFKAVQYLAGATTKHGRDRFAGAWAAIGSVKRLMDTPKADLAAAYMRERDRLLGVAP